MKADQENPAHYRKDPPGSRGRGAQGGKAEEGSKRVRGGGAWHHAIGVKEPLARIESRTTHQNTFTLIEIH